MQLAVLRLECPWYQTCMSYDFFVDLLVMLGDEFYRELSRDLVSVAAHTVVLKRPVGVFAAT